jgi:predicted membrane protein
MAEPLESAAEVFSLVLIFILLVLAIVFCVVQCYKLVKKMRRENQFNYEFNIARRMRENTQPLAAVIHVENIPLNVV